jgi:hypothetical protein
VGFEPAIPASELPQAQTMRPAGLANLDIILTVTIKLLYEIFRLVVLQFFTVIFVCILH